MGALLGVVALIGSTILVPRIGPNLLVLEPVLAVVAAAGLAHLVRRGSPWPLSVAVATVPWLFVILLATVGSFLHAGFPPWALRNVAQSAYAFALFYGALGWFSWHRRHLNAVVLGLAGAGLLALAGLILVDDPRERAPGFFYHSNYAAHFLVGAWLLVVLYTPRWRARLAATAVLVTGVVLTASFGAVLMLVAAGVYVLVRRLRTNPAVMLLAAVVVVAGWYVSYHPDVLEPEDVAVTDTLSSQRFERSSSGRVDLWQDALSVLDDSPLGVGPDGLRRSGALEAGKEAHNSYVAYLAERGPIGLLGLLGFGLALWWSAAPGGTARVLIVAYAAGNVVRETLHYRHMWLILGVAFVVDDVARRRARAAG